MTDTSRFRAAALSAAAAVVVATPAFAHAGAGSGSAVAAGIAHPLAGLDHVAAMIAVGLWAASKGGRALWVWPAAFVGVMLAGALLAMAGVSLPAVEPAILASVVALGLLVAFAVNVPVVAGAAIIGLFALFHGHAHGGASPEAAGGLAYLAGLAFATAALHLAGIAAAIRLGRLRGIVRLAGAGAALLGVGLAAGWV